MYKSNDYKKSSSHGAELQKVSFQLSTMLMDNLYK